MTMTHIFEEILWEHDSSLRAYPDACTRMQALVQDIRSKQSPEHIWLTEHPPLYTAGTSAKKEDLLNPQHYPTYDAGRGGQWTYHGPGQRLAYVMLDLTRPHGLIPPRDLRAYVKGLEQWLINTLALLDVDAFTREGRIGVWCIDPTTGQEAKIAALGIRISRWVSWHGISLNVVPNLDDFSGIIPCGIREYGVTSLQRFHPHITMHDADQALRASWESVFGTTALMTTD
ncbi:lipoyl(octanoyl) transferase LipB [Saccharibacter sp. EH611]|nr:lipoyl(octanoyl) transferase LipB [Saccharibacter sp. EH611]MXV58074.1 lipoyl(octanoyl) transferase LipB [Saccharibacter sp. EH70]MXV65348.1 lipoyl(octanoyl) transferase LipB [Saccharibacter sp. EH60]